MHSRKMGAIRAKSHASYITACIMSVTDVTGTANEGATPVLHFLAIFLNAIINVHRRVVHVK